MLKKFLILLFLSSVCLATVSSQYEPQTFPCNGSTKTFNFTFRIYQTSDLDVYLITNSTGDYEKLVENSTYSVSATNNDYTNGGTITTTTAYSSSYSIVAARGTELTQEARFITNKALENTLDRQILISQEIKNEADRAIRRTVADTDISLELPTVANRKSKFFAWDSSGLPIASSGGIDSNLLVSSYMEGVLDDANLTAFLTTLGFSSFVQTVFDDADAPEFRTTIGAISSSDIVRKLYAKTQTDSPVTITDANCDGLTVFTNTGATSTVLFNLPSGANVSSNNRITFIVTAAYALRIDPQSSESFIDFTQSSSAGKYISSSTVGTSIEIEWNGSKWQIISQNGIWDIES